MTYFMKNGEPWYDIPNYAALPKWQQVVISGDIRCYLEDEPNGKTRRQIAAGIDRPYGFTSSMLDIAEKAGIVRRDKDDLWYPPEVTATALPR